MALSNVSIAIVLIFALSLAQINAVLIGKMTEKLQFLVPQNIVRMRHHVPVLKWNDTLAEYAKAYARERSVDCALMHSNYNEPGYGECIAMSEGDLTPATSVELWVGEEKSYDYGSNTCKPGEMCGHYTQVVWKNTQSIGCASAKCQNGGTFITCNYYPPGNYEGERPY